jgi:hypothetical protein
MRAHEAERHSSWTRLTTENKAAAVPMGERIDEIEGSTQHYLGVGADADYNGIGQDRAKQETRGEEPTNVTR